MRRGLAKFLNEQVFIRRKFPKDECQMSFSKRKPPMYSLFFKTHSSVNGFQTFSFYQTRNLTLPKAFPLARFLREVNAWVRG